MHLLGLERTIRDVIIATTQCVRTDVYRVRLCRAARDVLPFCFSYKSTPEVDTKQENVVRTHAFRVTCVA
jgi:hypothetical protein